MLSVGKPFYDLTSDQLSGCVGDSPNGCALNDGVVNLGGCPNFYSLNELVVNLEYFKRFCSPNGDRPNIIGRPIRCSPNDFLVQTVIV